MHIFSFLFCNDLLLCCTPPILVSSSNFWGGASIFHLLQKVQKFSEQHKIIFVQYYNTFSAAVFFYAYFILVYVYLCILILWAINECKKILVWYMFLDGHLVRKRRCSSGMHSLQSRHMTQNLKKIVTDFNSRIFLGT